MEPVTKIATESEDAIWEQIEAIEEKSDAIFQRNAALWEKLDEICNALPDDYDFTNFDEAAFIRSTNALTEAEKETLLADIKELNELDAQMEALYEKLPDCDNMPLYEKALEKADPKVLDEIDTLEQEYDRVCEKHADLWDKVDEAYFNLPDDYDFDNYDEAAFIRSLSFLTDTEKDALIADYNRLAEIDSRLCELYNSIWGNTGCESGRRSAESTAGVFLINHTKCDQGYDTKSGLNKHGTVSNGFGMFFVIQLFGRGTGGNEAVETGTGTWLSWPGSGQSADPKQYTNSSSSRIRLSG